MQKKIVLPILVSILTLTACEHYYSLKASLPDSYESILEFKYSDTVLNISTIKDVVNINGDLVSVTYYEEARTYQGSTYSTEYLLVDNKGNYAYNSQEDNWAYLIGGNIPCVDIFMESLLFVNGKELYNKNNEIHVKGMETTIQVDKNNGNITTFRKAIQRTLQGHPNESTYTVKKFEKIVTTTIPHIDKF